MSLIYRQRCVPPSTASVHPHISLDDYPTSSTDLLVVTSVHFQETVAAKWPGWLCLGADASKSSTRTVIGVVFSITNKTEAWSLHNYCSVFGAEGQGILRAIHISAPLAKPTVIFSDSRSVIQAMANVSFSSPPIIIDLTAIVSAHTALIIIGWTPGHTNIPINEAADKAACRDPFSGSIWKPLMPRNLTWAIWDTTIATLTDSWSAALRNKGRDHLRPFAPWRYSCASSRHAETLLAQLRTETAPLNAFLYSQHLHDSPGCSHCGTAETTLHYWLHCPKYAIAHNELGNTMTLNMSLVRTLTPIYWLPASITPSHHVAVLKHYISLTSRFA
ncbi:uncharacterized protein [Centruroides vittatus]|uniref:uncharacterized protein n=1 Tax=Centruroides vittatus TaxID=120091 RepID=UPI00350E8E9F